eukprot:TRINITY_DN1597_c0_g1_i2.p1 TRINITY_DN1597_c0_g1~~TRINITY_DN1597_c0_g1_i2.p1  ORF type:complete len:755 (-),score=120.77 TRINITY_DN1597_c0_g1_i2:919-3183(-)
MADGVPQTPPHHQHHPHHRYQQRIQAKHSPHSPHSSLSKSKAAASTVEPLSPVALLAKDLAEGDDRQRRASLQILLQKWPALRQLPSVDEDAAEAFVMTLFVLLAHRNTAEQALTSDAAFRVLLSLFVESPPVALAPFVTGIRTLLEKLDLTPDHMHQRPPPPPQDLLRHELERASQGLWEEFKQWVVELEKEEALDWEAVLNTGKASATVARVKRELTQLQAAEEQIRQDTVKKEDDEWEFLIIAGIKKQKVWESIQLRVAYEDTLKESVTVRGVDEYGPCGRAGIEEGDEIVSLGGTPTPTYKAFMEAFRVQCKPGKSLTMTIMRDDLEIKRINLGFSIVETDPSGLMIKDIIRSGPADKAGFKDGDRLLAIAGFSTTTRVSFRRVFRKYSTPQTTVRFSVLRGDPPGTPVDLDMKLEVQREHLAAITRESVSTFEATLQVPDLEQAMLNVRMRKGGSAVGTGDGSTTSPGDTEFADGSTYEPAASVNDEENEEAENFRPINFTPLRRNSSKTGDALFGESGEGEDYSDTAASDNGDPDAKALVDGPLVLRATTFHLDYFLNQAETRAACVRLLRALDAMGIFVDFFLREAVAYMYIPKRISQRANVFRDFVQCPPRPRSTFRGGASKTIHIKSNILAKSDIMYRFVVEGYNYGTNAVILSDCVGYTHKRWDRLGKMEEYGWPTGWDRQMINDYALGCELTQYYSADMCVTLRLRAKSFFCVGFSVSAWLVCHGYGADFRITATVHHQDVDL